MVIASAIGIHGDEKGLRLPPEISPKQITIIPILFKKGKEEVLAKCEELKKEFESAGLRVNIDDRDIRPGKKFYDWELKGTPIKLELGPRDLENNKTIAMRRDELEKIELDLDENLVGNVISLIDELNENLAESAKEFHKDHIKFASDIDEVKELIEAGNVVAVNWCGDTACGQKIEEITGYSVLGIYEELEGESKKCIISDEDAKYVALIAKTY